MRTSENRHEQTENKKWLPEPFSHSPWNLWCLGFTIKNETNKNWQNVRNQLRKRIHFKDFFKQEQAGLVSLWWWEGAAVRKSGQCRGNATSQRESWVCLRVLHHTWHLTWELSKISTNTELYLAKGGKEDEGNKSHLSRWLSFINL